MKEVTQENWKKKFTARNRNLPTVSACDGELLLRNIDGKKSTGIDKIQPKLIKLSEELLSHPLAIAINNSFNKWMFPDNSMRFSLG